MAVLQTLTYWALAIYSLAAVANCDVEIDLLLPRNETYALQRGFPTIFAVQGPQNVTNSLQAEITWHLCEDRPGCPEQDFKNCITRLGMYNPKVNSNKTTIYEWDEYYDVIHEDRWGFEWFVNLTGCAEEGSIFRSGGNAIYFTVKEGGVKSQLVPDKYGNAQGMKIKISGTSVTCESHGSPSPTATLNVCGPQPDSQVVASLSSHMASFACVLHTPPIGTCPPLEVSALGSGRYPEIDRLALLFGAVCLSVLIA